MGEQATRLVVCDGHAFFAESLAVALAPHGFAAHPTTTLAAARAALREPAPLLVIEADLPDGDGLAVLPALLAAAPGTRAVVVSADAAAETGRRAVARGAACHLPKTITVRDLAHALRRVLRGEHVEAPTARGPRTSPETAAAHRLAAHLTPRERECLALLVQGESTTAMERRMGVSGTTVRTHVQALLTKLGVHSRVDAAAFAVRHRLLAPPPDRV
ncbi:helix-turn-helix transcriptional regulator [Actinokineospora pegani]|uniref:helix-turn-helix transcriptional regulator n=1 Tax=Actinokineospora pegani TaxID=2654637 RepID=UPI0018D39EDC|nr:response regulator transcription factor [Actinokineospora pegani]